MTLAYDATAEDFDSGEFEWDDDAPFPSGRGETWTRVDLVTDPETGRISGTARTNDNLDQGYPTEHASWEESYADRADLARHYATKSPWYGILGGRVDVFVDGEHWDPSSI